MARKPQATSNGTGTAITAAAPATVAKVDKRRIGNRPVNQQNQVRPRKTSNLGAGTPQKNPHVQRVPGKNGNGVAVIIDEQVLTILAATHMPFHRMAMILGVGSAMLARNPKYRAIIDKARALKQQELLEAQFMTAITDRNPTMQIWLGKQYLDQKDVSRIETTGKDGGPVEQKTLQVTAVIPANGRDDGPGARPLEEVMDGAEEIDEEDRVLTGVRGDEIEWEPYTGDEWEDD